MSISTLRVLVVDDSALFRQLLQNVLRRIPDTEVAGVATDGPHALELVAELRPDVVTLDVQMPGMTGIDVLREFRRRGCRARVIMVSSLTAEGAPATVDALMEGAFDVLQKPAGMDPHLARELITRELAAKLAAVREGLGRGDAAGPASTGSSRPLPVARPPRGASLRHDAIVIGTSTGGPEALRTVLGGLPGSLPVPVLIVQHIPPIFSASLAARLHALSRIAVVEAEDGMPVEAGWAYLAPGNRHLRLRRRGTGVACGLDEEPPRLGCRPSLDNLLESAAEVYDGRVVAAVLTGMGTDGLAGCRRLKAAGGKVIVQAKEGCAVFGMPKAVQEHGLADAVVPLEGVAAALVAAVT